MMRLSELISRLERLQTELARSAERSECDAQFCDGPYDPEIVVEMNICPSIRVGPINAHRIRAARTINQTIVLQLE